VKIVVAGYGPVGQAVAESLMNRGIQIVIDDPHKDHYVTVSDTENLDGVVVCVATPQRDDGTCNTDNVRDVFDKYRGTKFLIKSAVDPVWLKSYHAATLVGLSTVSWEEQREKPLDVTYSPEFLGSSNAFRDPTEEFLNQTFAIYGGDSPRWWDELFRPSLPYLTEVKYCTLEQAAFAKYVENCFLATKVTFFNEMHEIYNELGFEGFDQMVDAITIDPRIGRSHTQVPGPDGQYGWGGHCLPKDMNAMKQFSNGAPLIETVIEQNGRHRAK
jgi:UDPglucose 6-dehydrogenase